MWCEVRLISWINELKRYCLNNHMKSEEKPVLPYIRTIDILTIESSSIKKIL